MFTLYYIIEADGRLYWVPLAGKDMEPIQFNDSQDAAQAVESCKMKEVKNAKEFEIRSDTHDRTMRGIRFGSEVIWRINGSKKPIQYRGNVDRFVG